MNQILNLFSIGKYPSKLFNILLTFKAFSSVPKVQVTVKHGIPNQKQDAMSFWIENVTRSQLKVCLRESRTFDGPHSNIVVVWQAFLLFSTFTKFVIVLSIPKYLTTTIFNGYERENYFFNTEQTEIVVKLII